MVLVIYDRRSDMIETAVHAYNPLAALLTVPGSADAVGAQLRRDSGTKDMTLRSRAVMLYDAWLSFFRGETDKASETAVGLFSDIGDDERVHALVQKEGVSYLICCLARYDMSGYHVGSAVSFLKSLKEGEDALSKTAETDLAMYEMSVGIMSDIPEWIRKGDLGVCCVEDRLHFCGSDVFEDNIYPGMLAAIQYANYTGNHRASLMLIDTAEKIFCMRGLVITDIYLTLYRAVNYEAMGFSEQADESLKKVVALIAPDKLWQIVSEFVPFFDDRLMTFVKEADEKGARVCARLSEGFYERVRKLHAEEKKARSYMPLTPKELDVMRLVAMNYRIADIAKKMNVETVTVNFHKKNACRKLGIDMRGDVKEALRRHEISALWLPRDKA